MISLKELRYVGAPAYKAPFPGEEYASQTLDSMVEVFSKYEEKYRKKDYSVVFSDASEMNFEILDANICHMLGIDYSALLNGYYDKFLKDVLGIDRTLERITSYGLVESLLNNKEKLIDYDSTTTNRALNYYKARIKCAIFDKISDFENFNFIKLDTGNASKLLITFSNEVNCPYFCIRLTPTEEVLNPKYCVNSLVAPEKNTISNYFEHPASIPTQILIDDNNNLTKLVATPREKIELLNTYKNIILDYSLEDKMDITSDYVALLTELDNKSKRKTL